MDYAPLAAATLDAVVGQAGLEPAVLKASDLQSDGVTNFPTLPYRRPNSKARPPSS